MIERPVSDILEELVAWTKFAHHHSLVETLGQILADRASFLAYEASDGTHTQTEVADIAEISQPTVSRMYGRWRRLGLMRDVGGRGLHLARPTDLGIAIPES